MICCVILEQNKQVEDKYVLKMTQESLKIIDNSLSLNLSTGAETEVIQYNKSDYDRYFSGKKLEVYKLLL